MSLRKLDNILSGLYARTCGVVPAPVRRLLPSWTLINFGLSSCALIVVDMGIFTAVCLSLEGAIGRSRAIALGVVIARFVSGNCNYVYNQRVVFRHPATLKSFFQYWALVIVKAAVSISATGWLAELLDANGLAITLVNFCVDVVLFALSFTIQKSVIFRNGGGQ